MMSISSDPSQDAPPASSRATDPSFVLYCAMGMVWLAGLLLTFFLMWTTRGDGLPPGCGVDQGCGIVLNSEYSRVIGLSLTTWAAGYFAVAGLFMFLARFSFQISLAPPISMLLFVISSLGLAAGIWSTIVMGVFLKEFCYYCVALHTCNFVFFILTFNYAVQDWRNRQYRRWKANVPPLPTGPLVFHGILATLLVAGQVVVMSLFHSDAPAKLVPIEFNSVLDIKAIGNVLDKLCVDVAPPGGTAILTSKGSHDAPNRIVTFGCLTCPHCKRANEVFKAMMVRYPGKIRVDVRFFPLGKCNDIMRNRDPGEKHKHACKLARDAWAVAMAKPDEFSGYVNWLYDNQDGMTSQKSSAKSKELVGAAEYTKARQSDDVALREQQDLSLARDFGLTGVPHVFMSGGQVYGGMSFKSLETLFTKQFGLTPSSTAIDLDPEDEGLILLSKRTVNKIAMEGRFAEQNGDFKRAEAKYRRVLELQPDAWGVVLAHANLLATCGDDDVFNPKEADRVFSPASDIISKREELVNEMPEKTSLERRGKKESLEKIKGAWARYHEVGAAVHAANDRFKKACQDVMRAIRYFQTKGDTKTVKLLEERFDNFYNRGVVYRKPLEEQL